MAAGRSTFIATGRPARNTRLIEAFDRTSRSGAAVLCDKLPTYWWLFDLRLLAQVKNCAAPGPTRDLAELCEATGLLSTYKSAHAHRTANSRQNPKLCRESTSAVNVGGPKETRRKTPITL